MNTTGLVSEVRWVSPVKEVSLRALSVMFLCLFSPSAMAYDDDRCTRSPLMSEFPLQLEQAEVYLSAGEFEPARAILSVVHRQLLCSQEPVPVPLTVHLTRLFAIAFFFDQEEDAVNRWMRSGHYADATRAWL